ncbi:beta-lactamase family protein [Cellulomonas sp. Sa3CUA2]|uniref:Beta-lactamase family protein n=1 Tax=Cellulomonas avistercoris TaxID=2762242 RepID=A0ABR8QFW7_9CELL|nr:serine hydrolase domain-containing protein [Cellulomonas avistercoris]MBD7919317.1 beta-lactamase family protein [Cellulomonas avistercoris]
MRPPRPLLPRSAPAATGASSRALSAFVDRLESPSVEAHSLVVVHRGHVVAEGWWAPYTPRRPQLLYSLTKSFTAVAVGLAVGDGLLSLDDRVVDVLPDHVPDDAPEQARRLTVRHLLTMTTGHGTDTLDEAWRLEQRDLVRGFLRVVPVVPEGTQHAYDNATTFVLARMVERVTSRGLPELLDERLFMPMGIDDAEWDRVGSGVAYGFHGLHLTTEAVAAFGELLRCGGRWGDRQLVPAAWVGAATGKQVESVRYKVDDSHDTDYTCGYGYQTWVSRHGSHGSGAYGQMCVVVPWHDLVVAVTAQGEGQAVLDAVWDCLLPGLAGANGDDEALAARLRRLALPTVAGSPGPAHAVTATVPAADGAVRGDSAVPADAVLPDGTTVVVTPVPGGWSMRLGTYDVEVGHGTWRQSAPLGRPVAAVGGWQGAEFVADVYPVMTPHRVRLTVDATAGTATATWSTLPLTTPRLDLHLRAPLMTRPEHA